MKKKTSIQTVVKEINEQKNCGTEDSFITAVSYILMNSGITDESKIHQIFYLSEIPMTQGISIFNKIEYLADKRNCEIEKYTARLTEKLRFKFDISPDEARQIEFIIKSEFELNHMEEYFKEHEEVDIDSFILGFIACILTCIN